jgi:hypothetical protein
MTRLSRLRPSCAKRDGRASRLWFAMVVLFGLVTSANAQDAAKEKIVGIEISSTSVRVVLIQRDATGAITPIPVLNKPGEMGREFKTNLTGTAVVEKRDGADVKVYPSDELKKVVKTVQKFHDDVLLAHKGDKVSFRIVASSGVAAGISNMKDLADLLKSSIESLPPLDFVSADDELRFGFMGVVPEAEMSTSLLADIGGGNTKIGYAIRDAEGKFIADSTDVEFGTNTLNKAAEKVAKSEKIEFSDAVKKVHDDKKITESLTEGVTKMRAKKDGAGRNKVYAVGGAPFALVTMMYPSKADIDEVPISLALLKEYKQELLKNGVVRPIGELPAAGSNAATRFESDMKVVTSGFSLEKQLAGAEMLGSVFAASGLAKEEDVLVFSRKGLYSWITMYVVEKSAKKKAAAEVDPVKGNDDSAKQIAALTSAVTALQAERAGLSEQVKRLTEKIESMSPAPAPGNGASAAVEKLLREISGKLDQLAPLRQEVQQLRKQLESRDLGPGQPTPVGATSNNNREKALDYYLRAVDRMNRHLPKDALAYLQSALRESDQEPIIWYAYGIVQTARGDTLQAEQSADSYLKLKELGLTPTLAQFESLSRIQGDARYAFSVLVEKKRDEKVRVRATVPGSVAMQ